jgi:anthranilate synthase component 1
VSPKLPDAEMFRARYQSGIPQLLWTTTVSDLETPVSAFIKLAAGRPNSVLLESVEGGAARGRYSIIMLDPDLVWRVRGDRAEVNRFALTDPNGWRAEEAGALASLRRLLAESRVEVPPGLPPMSAGVVGYLAYDFVRRIERIPETNPDPLGLPDGILMRPTIVAVFDTVADTLTFATTVRPQPGVDAGTARAAAEARLAAAAAAMARPLPPPPAAPASPPDPGAVRSNMTKEAYKAAVAKAVAYIHAGDAFQVVPSQRFAVPFALPPFALYRSLRRLNPSPFLFFLDFGGFAVVGSSPEIMVRLREGIVTIRPLAGTRPRGATHEEDVRLEHDLLNDPKERAEHLMLLDLGRNDVGRVAAIGTVQVKEQFTVERYSHVMHISSHVEGRLRPGLDAVDALMAGFPAGTLSGAPKVRAMEIIEELEPERRGVYAGCIGYFAAGGDMDTCIGLRTAVVKDGTMYVQAGAGVVADSDPETEYQETVHKARALIRAAEEAVRFAAGAGR